MYINSKKWTAFANSVQGYAHKKTNLINQDSFHYHLDIDNNIFVAILSDGAGSAVNSKIGSSFCCLNIGQEIKKLGLDLCKKRYIDNEVEQGIKDIIKNHLDSFNAFDAPIKTFHHTLSAVLITPFGGLIVRVGDSPIVVVTHHDFHQNQGFSAELLAKNTVFDEDKLHGYANQTTFLTSPKWESSIEIDRLPENAIAIFLMSDGAGSLFVSNNKLFVPSIDELFSRLNKNTSEPHEVLQDFLNLPEANEITGDDKTFIGLVPDFWLHSKGKKKNLAHNLLTEAAVQSLLVIDSSSLDVNGGKKNDATPFKLENNDFLSLSETSKVESGRPEAQTQQNQAVKPTENNFSKMVQHRNTSLLNTKQNTTQQNNPKETTTLELMAPVNAPVLGSLKKSFLDKNKNVILVFILLFSIILAGFGGYFYHKFQSQADKKAVVPADKKPAVIVDKKAVVPADKKPAVIVDKKAVVPADKKPAVIVDKKAVVPADKKPAVTVDKKAVVPADKKPAVTVDKKAVVPADKKPAVTVDKKAVVPADKKPAVTVDKKAVVPADNNPEVTAVKKSVDPADSNPEVTADNKPVITVDNKPSPVANP